MTTVAFSELLDAFDFSSFGPAGEIGAYVDLVTGSLLCVSDDDFDETAPEDLQSSERYLPLPSKRDLDLGQPLIREFVESALPDDYDRVIAYFRQRGAYRKFKDLLEDRGVVDAWYAFERRATEEALKVWCEDNGIAIDYSAAPAGTVGGAQA